MPVQVSQLENHEWNGFFYIMGQESDKFPGCLRYTVNCGIESNIEISFFCRNFKLEKSDYSKIYGTIQMDGQKFCWIKVGNLMSYREGASFGYDSYFTYTLKYEYILMANSLELLDSQYNKVSFAISELATFFERFPQNVLLAGEVFSERYDNKVININWQFNTSIFNELSTYLFSFKEEKNEYYLRYAEVIDGKFKDFLLQNNIDKHDVHFEKRNVMPFISISLAKDEQKGKCCNDNIIKEFLNTLKLFEITSNYPVIPDYIMLTTNKPFTVRVDDWEKPILDRNGNIHYQTYADAHGNQKIAKNENDEDLILYEQKFKNYLDENGNICYRSLQMLYAFKRNPKAVKKDLYFHPAIYLSFRSLITGNDNLFGKWNAFYSQPWVVEILRFLFIIRREGYYYTDLIVGDIFTAINCIGDEMLNSTHHKVATNIKVFFEKIATEKCLARVCEIFSLQNDTVSVQDYFLNKNGERLMNKKGIIFKQCVVEIGNILAQDIRNVKAHLTSGKNTQVINDALNKGLCDILLRMIESYVYKQIGIQPMIVDEILNNYIHFNYESN